MPGGSPSDLPDVLAEAARSVSVLTTAERTARTLRGAILDGSIARGTQVGESRISKSLGVSRNTAREALRLLVAEGLVSHQPNHSPVVTVLEADDVADVFVVRRVIEFGAIDMIAERGGVGNLQPLRRAVEMLARLVDTGDPTEVVEADLAFHAALVAAAGSPRLVTAFGRIESEVRLCLSISTRSHAGVQDLVDQHDSFLRLIEAGDLEEFRALLRRHMDDAVRRVSEGLRATTSQSRKREQR